MSTIINYENKLAQEAAANEKKERDRADAEGWAQVLAKWTLHDTQANFQIVKSWCAPNPITVEGCAALLRDNPQSLDMWSREKIIRDIVAHSHGSANELRDLAFRLTTFSLSQLREKRRSIEFKAALGNSKDKAKEYLASQRETEIGWNGTGYPRLAATLVPPGEFKSVPTGDFLRKIAREDGYLFKRYVRIYSSPQVDYWLNN